MIPEARTIDRVFHALWASQTGGISPLALWLAGMDWALHLATSPGKQMELAATAGRLVLEWQQYAASCALGIGDAEPCVEPPASDRRFNVPEWQDWPFNAFYQAFLLQQQLLDEATRSVRGVSRQNENVVNFCARQLLDMLSPSNFAFTNPEVIRRTAEQGGANLVRGGLNFMEDAGRFVLHEPPAGLENFRVGETLAVTPGKVVYRNDLIELIQYSPMTAEARPEPIVIFPAWIMKFYVLDLSRHNSLVRFLVEQGFTVFMVSWKNPDASYRDYGLDHYRRLGVMAALDTVGQIIANTKVHAVGYCLGGTLLAMAAAAMARDGDERLKTMTLLAAQTDFSEPGELELFVSEGQVAFLEDMMEEYGFLEGRQMAATFQLMRSNDLIWSRWLHDYLIGERQPANDLMAWNADATRMPARMHSEYLREIFLKNKLAQGQYIVGDRPVTVRDIRVPIFCVATEWDHVAPWRSVYKLRLLVDTDVAFALTNGGHNAGIASEPGHRNRVYRIATSHHDDPYIGPDAWLRATAVREGTWWIAWVDWLKARSGAPVPARKTAAGLCNAPGSYVFE